ncbi:hypothetical protein Pint_27678 [Pistacia integerrima]|uniref:Uncharacterized protein n=1 Tax=Pistacia integerrima TaxID=434235 RepID=A0ACC0YPG2_9ROSI|nr:hypothetical protein Pint_27678 [Pistacia integerrima]
MKEFKVEANMDIDEDEAEVEEKEAKDHPIMKKANEEALILQEVVRDAINQSKGTMSLKYNVSIVGNVDIMPQIVKPLQMLRRKPTMLKITIKMSSFYC